MIVDCAGGLYSFGFPQYGQLGHNTEGKYFASGNKLAYKCELLPRKVMFFIEKTRDGHILPVDNVHVTDVACGINHSLAMDSKNRCFSWGFGGYGRLGHSEVSNLHVSSSSYRLFVGKRWNDSSFDKNFWFHKSWREEHMVWWNILNGCRCSQPSVLLGPIEDVGRSDNVSEERTRLEWMGNQVGGLRQSFNCGRCRWECYFMGTQSYLR